MRVFLFCLVVMISVALPAQAVVGIHDSELTRALMLSNASPTTPSGPGTTGKEWWTTNWNYFVMPESLQEALRADGTLFEVVTDEDIAAGRLLGQDGKPRFPILFSLASEAIADEEVAPLTNYVAAGGFLFVGSSAFTRNTNGTARGNFALSAEMGVQCLSLGLTNWGMNTQFGKQMEHRLTAHIPGDLLNWEMPGAAEEIPWGRYPHPSNPLPGSPVWRVASTGATVLASGNSTPLLLEKRYGSGRMLYYAPMQPLMGHGGWSPGMYAYLIFRNAAQWAFESAQLPVVKLSPWPFAYDAAFMVRHDLENYQNMIAGIENFARFEHANGAKGNYYFVTGTLREDMSPTYDTNAVVAGMRRAVSNYSAFIGPHNGGLRNPYNHPPLSNLDYDYWHWGPDEALDAVPNGYSSGKEYAMVSVSNAFVEVESWLGELASPGARGWVAPYFNSVREDSMDILSQLNVKTTGEKKLTFFPHWTLSSAISGKRYPILSVPVSDWFVGATVSQSIEAGHSLETLRKGIDFYYEQGGLINFYGHLLNTNGLQGEYVRYGMNTNLHPRLWPANAPDLYGWWSQRSAVSVLASHYATNVNEAMTAITITGATNQDLAVELTLPPSTVSALQVLTNSVAAAPPAYRLDALRLKVRVGSAVTNVHVRYHLDPKAFPDSYGLAAGPFLEVSDPGVLGNDLPGTGGGALTAWLETPPTNGFLMLSTNGSFTYTPSNSFAGTDVFIYRVADGVTQSAPATVTISGQFPGWSDDFTRPGPPAALDPWVVRLGNWSIAGGELLDGPNAVSSYATVYYPASWSDYAVSARVRLEAGAFGGGVGGRLNASTGARYAAWLYPAESAGGSNVLKLIKFQNWTSWTLLQQADVADVGTNWHTVRLAFFGNRIAVWLDGSPVVNATDGSLPLATGGITLGNWTATLPELVRFDDVRAGPLVTDDNYYVAAGGTLQVSAPGVLGNDASPLGGSFPAELVRGPEAGSVTFNPDGSFTYVPVAGFMGTDRFIYRAGGQTTGLGSAWVNISVGLENPPPEIQSIRVVQSAAELSWSSVPGRLYRLQYTDTLSPVAWSNAVPDLVALGPTLSATNALGGGMQRYYRVLLLP